MQDPEVREKMKAMEEAMKRPEVQQQMEMMQTMMQNQEMQQRIASLKDDPELAPMFAEIQKGGMAAFQKYFQDPKVLAKIGEKMGPPPGVAAAAPPQAAPSQEINNLLDAAKYGDQEAVEDFIAIGKDVNMTDAEKRTPLHYSVAYCHINVFDELLSNGAAIEAKDTKANTPLHYAAGYGRVDFVVRLLEAGADGSAQNASGHTPFDLVKMEQRNPINADSKVLKMLEDAKAGKA
ncbi:hypothetical protein WJX72_006215 [[Myrmecia] bisecta]|uniref:Uncharacterized protein n=1 Tax=[Myrmecia] bisecta TaxID=41462 RepID=A0AAW1Q7D7_9CHLO